ncbi:uncharacterized protein LOC105702348 [Orussus abietinus]|uniref:uncharacterized protein LOC105702348 n=1 Tax=Orussus abietinus TaxID=222816 RepID=UPI000C7162B4|nr:uncharacterized protein LOC105702348 [Orussus abietinus]
MTKCVNKPSNLKSSVYNLTGQNYFEQLTAYNSMCAHLRRVLLAKRVVDTRRPRSERQRSRSQQRVSCKSRSSEFELSNDIIDRLAYDTEHHPIDILKMSWDYKHPHAGNRNNECCRSVCNLRSMDRSRSRIQSDRSCTGRKTPKDCSTQKKSTSPSPQRGKFNDENGKGIKFSRPNTNPPRCCKIGFRKWKYEQEGASCEYASSFESSPGASCGGFSSVGNTSPARSADGYGFKEPKSSILRKSASESEEEARYTKFVYDITQEIMHNALYTDKELQNVFRKHLNKNTGILNKGRMMYEIHRLKIALNIPDESDDEEEYESMYSFSNLPAKPPTPPKVLDDNKVMEKLQSYLRLDEYASRRSTGSKNVILVDANPELLVTERDVLMTLVEMDVEPKQAESICKSLLSKSRDTSTSHMVRAT